MEISFDIGEPITYILTEEEFREWQLTRERLKAREEEINRLHEWVKELEKDRDYWFRKFQHWDNGITEMMNSWEE